MISKILEVRLSRDGRVWNKEGQPVCNKDGNYYLVGKDDMEALLQAVEVSDIERTLLMGDDFLRRFPEGFEVEGEHYYINPKISLITGRAVYIRYLTLNDEFREEFENR